MSWELDQVLGPPLQTSGPPHDDLQYLPLFDEAELDNYFAWLKKGGIVWKECLILRKRMVEDDRKKEEKKTNKKDQKQAFRFSCLRGSKEDKEQLGPGYPVLSGN